MTHWQPSQIITIGKSLSSNLIKVELHESCDRPIKGLVELAHVNARSISNKILDFQEYISSKNVDVCAITEMWLKKDDALICKQIPCPGYKIYSVPRQDACQCGRIAIVNKDYLTITKITEGNQPTMEFSVGDYR